MSKIIYTDSTFNESTAIKYLHGTGGTVIKDGVIRSNSKNKCYKKSNQCKKSNE